MTASSLCIALAQLNPTLGDVAGNASRLLAARAQAREAGAELLVLPELFLSGAPPQGLLRRTAFIDACRKACEELARTTADGGPAILLGLPWREEGSLYNAYALLDAGMIQSVRFKHALCDAGLRDETRLFARGPLPGPVQFRDRLRLGFVIGEDLATEDVAECLAETGAELLLAPSALPWHRGAGDLRMNRAVARIVETGLPLICLNQLGGQDELVFDGSGAVFNSDRSLAAQLPAFRESFAITQWRREGGEWRCEPGEIAEPEAGDAADYTAIMLGLRDVVAKGGRDGVALSLTGDPASALCAAIAVDALGSDHVVGVTFEEEDASGAAPDAVESLARELGIQLERVAAAPISGALRAALPAATAAADDSEAVGRLLIGRGQAALLQTLAGALGYAVLSPLTRTGVLTADHVTPGAFRPLKDVDAAQALSMLALRRTWKPVDARGPGNPLLKVRGRAGDEELDIVLGLLVGYGLDVRELVARGHDPQLVAKAERLVREAGLARRNEGPGILLTASRIEGQDAMPAVQAFHDTGEPPHEPGLSLLRPGVRNASANPDV